LTKQDDPPLAAIDDGNAFGSRFASYAAIDLFYSDPTSSALAILRERIAEFPSAISCKPGDISLQRHRSVAVEVARRAIFTVKFANKKKPGCNSRAFDPRR
jgi:hypothetical protein